MLRDNKFIRQYAESPKQRIEDCKTTIKLIDEQCMKQWYTLRPFHATSKTRHPHVHDFDFLVDLEKLWLS